MSSFAFRDDAPFELDPRVVHIDQLSQLVHIPVPVSIQIDIGRDIERHHPWFFLGLKLNRQGVTRPATARRGNFGREVRLVALKVIVAIDEDPRVETWDDLPQVLLGEIGETQMLGSLDMDAVVAKIRPRIKDDRTRVLAHLQERVKIDQPLRSVRLNGCDQIPCKFPNALFSAT